MNTSVVEMAPLPRQLLVLGSTDSPDSPYAPTRPGEISWNSTERLMTADWYLESHPEVGEGAPWTIAVVGGYAGMAFGEKEMSTEYHHGALMKDAFTEVPNRPSTVWHDGTVSEFGEFGIRGIPEERIRSGVGSDSTVTDFAYAMGLTFDEKGKLQKDDRDGFLEGGSLSPDDYNAEHPLGVVAHPEHMKRVLRVAKAFGFMHILPIATNGEYGLAERTDGPLREFVLRAAITWGTNNPETMRKREVRIANALDLVRRGVGLLSLSRTTEQPSN